MSNNELVIEKDYKAPIQSVWSALTDCNQMKLWYFDIKDFKAEPGFEFSFSAGEGEKKYVHVCKIIGANPVTRLSYSWRYEGYAGDTVVTFELMPTSENTTHLRLTHAGLETFPSDVPDLSADNFREGWEHILGVSLANMVETETIKLDFNINAPADRVLQVLTHPNHSWGTAFGGGALAHTDWKEGSDITWTDLEENVGARGKIAVKNNDRLEMRYYDAIDPQPGEQLGEYTERFTLQTMPDGQTHVAIEAGPLQKLHIGHHKAAWEKALPLIQKTAEK